MNSYFKLSLPILLAICLYACGSEDKPKSSSALTYEVTSQPLHQSLHFTGSIQPLRESTIASPLEAVVDSMPVHYGHLVKKGDVILTLNSTELQKQYNDSLTDYLKAKDSYTIAKAKFTGTQELWDAGLISKNNFLSEKSGLDTARITLMQATRKLTELLEKMDDAGPQNLSALSLADFDKIKKILASNHQLIRLKAPNDGIMLYPPKSGEDKSARVGVGSTLKAGQVIALIGDLSGISVEIDVPEIDIAAIHPGMEAIVSGIAFGNHPLKGKLVAVNSQASNTGSGGLPSFTAIVEVRQLTPAQQQWIKVGMSAAIELHSASENQLIIPIAAVKRQQGKSIVTVQLPNGKTETRAIKTGAAQSDTVAVESGLSAGDVVIYE